jgi:hypothetical protein
MSKFLIISAGHPFGKNSVSICFYSEKLGSCFFSCDLNEKPFYSREFTKKETNELIEFLQNSLDKDKL